MLRAISSVNHLSFWRTWQTKKKGGEKGDRIPHAPLFPDAVLSSFECNPFIFHTFPPSILFFPPSPHLHSSPPGMSGGSGRRLRCIPKFFLFFSQLLPDSVLLLGAGCCVQDLVSFSRPACFDISHSVMARHSHSRGLNDQKKDLRRYVLTVDNILPLFPPPCRLPNLRLYPSMSKKANRKIKEKRFLIFLCSNSRVVGKKSDGNCLITRREHRKSLTSWLDEKRNVKLRQRQRCNIVISYFDSPRRLLVAPPFIFVPSVPKSLFSCQWNVSNAKAGNDIVFHLNAILLSSAGSAARLESGEKKSEGSLLSRHWFYIYTGTLVWYQPDRIESWKKLCWRDNKFPFFFIFSFSSFFFWKFPDFVFFLIFVGLLTGAKTTGPIQSSSLRI